MASASDAGPARDAAGPRRLSLRGRPIVRAPNHLGDLVMALPALAAAPAADVAVVRGLAPLLELARRGTAEPDTRVVAVDRGVGGTLATARRLRERRYHGGVLLTPALSAALLFRLGGVGAIRGTATDGRRLLLHEVASARMLYARHRAAQYLHLVTGQVAPATPPRPRLALPADLMERWRVALAGWVRGDVAYEGRTVGLFPGSNASSRRWMPARFRALAEALAGAGDRVVVFGGPGEAALTAEVAGAAAVDLGGRTDLPLLAAGLAACDLVVSNDSGPLHLAAAVGTPTVSLWGAGDPAATGVTGPDHVLLRHPELPCVPCVKNRCPRSGAGTFLPEAERECLQLIDVPDVLAAARPRPAPEAAP